jgi:hypothetical protein
VLAIRRWSSQPSWSAPHGRRHPFGTHEQITAKESQLVRDVGGEISHVSILKRAPLHGVMQIDKSEWFTSADDLAEHFKRVLVLQDKRHG